MSEITNSPSRYTLRSECKAHGKGCNCKSTEELPNRRRSMSRNSSRASSVAPELSQPTLEPLNLYSKLNGFSNNQHHNTSYESHTTTSTNKYSSHFNLLSRRIDEEFNGSERISRSSINYTEQDRISVHSHHSLFNDDEDRLSTTQSTRSNNSNSSRQLFSNNRGRHNSGQRSQQMIKTFNGSKTSLVNYDEEDYSSDDNQSVAAAEASRQMALLNSSTSSNSTTTVVGKRSSKTNLNGNHRTFRGRTTTIYEVKSTEEDDEDEDDEEMENGSALHLQGSQIYSSEISTSKAARVLSSVRHGLMYIPEFIYWALVNLFVLEKWLLHRPTDSTYSVFSALKKLIFLGLLFLLGMYLYSSSGCLVPIWDKLSSSISSASDFSVPIKPVVPPPSLSPNVPLPPVPIPKDTSASPSIPTPTPCNLSQSVEYQRLLEKIDFLERSQEEYKQKAEESYKSNLELLQQTINFNLKQEILKIEPKETKIIVEKETIVEQAPPPQIIIEKHTEPTPVNHEEISKFVLPLILPSVLEKLQSEIKAVQVECPKEAEKAQEEEKPVQSTEVHHHHHHDGSIDMTDIEKMIRAAIYKYDADKTGLPDLALEPAGGSILSTRCTKSSPSKQSVLYLWGWRIWSYSNSPRSIIQPGVVPGECWVVEGATAEVVIQLVSPAIITGFTLEHIPKSISPYGKIDTAPKKFQVVGLMSEHDLETTWDYGTFQYEDNEEPIQYFEVQNKTTVAYPIVELKVLSNHGSVKSTCIYRFRVHGQNIAFKS